MDTSKEYIKMCEKADEIQRERPVAKLKAGDFIADWRFKENEVIVYSSLIHDVGFGEEGPDDEFTWWLPRQDQLQDMMFYGPGVNWVNPLFMMDKIWSFSEGFNHKSTKTFSMEQLWLAFVMKEKYNKIWDGETWHKCKK